MNREKFSDGSDRAERIAELCYRYANGTITPDESMELDSWINEDDRNRQRFRARVDDKAILENLAVVENADAQKAAIRDRMPWEEIYSRANVIRMKNFNRWRLSVAVCMGLLTCSGILYFIRKFHPSSPPILVAGKMNPGNDIMPGGNKAVLVLADGRPVILDSAKDGTLALQGTSRIVKLTSGQLAYQAAVAGPAIGFNTISTPRGGTYQVTLPDGSKAWLNAESSIRFPTSFGPGSREVEISGEAYFEIKKDPGKPFRVSAGPLTISVLGTSFNIRSYKDEQARATLTSGAVRVSRGNEKITLSPGEQAVSAAFLQKAPDADIESATAWKDNLLIFNHSTIEEVMSELGRWYDVDVRYEGEKTNKKISAILRRDAVASSNLEILKVSGYKFRIEGKTIVVLPD